jgi:uncharacterized membrane protein
VLVATATPAGSLVLMTAVFLASAVEMVEALTIVLAVGVTRGWKSAFEGVAVALAALAGLVLLFGPALVHYVPLSVLRLVVGGLLLVFGLQWLRKAILRAAGLKAKHDEDVIFARQVSELSETPPAPGRDATAFTVAFKGVFLEGLEVVVIVITLGYCRSRGGRPCRPYRGSHRPPPVVRRPRKRHENGRRSDAGQLRYVLGG